jgi:hypothetical protein
MKDRLCYFQFRRSVVVKAGRKMFTFPLISIGPWTAFRDICSTVGHGREATCIWGLSKYS